MSERATVLIVHDEPGTYEPVADALRRRGHTVCKGHPRRGGLAMLEAAAIDVAIVDIGLPDAAGLKLLEAIRRAGPDTEVILITGHAIVTAIAAINGAAFAYLSKPFETAHLLATLDKARQKQELNRALRELEERFRATFEQAAVGIAHSAMNGRWLRVNQRCCDILGYTRDELLAGPLLDITQRDEPAVDDGQIRRFLAGEIPTLSREKRFVHKNGSDVWVDMTISVARDPVERSDYFIAVLQDITARKQLEQELVLAQRMEGVGELAGGIAHDFNNLLTVISGRSQLALERLGPDDPLRRHLDLIHKTSARAAKLAHQLLAFSR